MKTILLILFFTLMISGITFGQTPPIETGVSQALAKWRAANYSDVRYKFNITLEKGAPLMTGTIEISVNLTEEGAKNDLLLDWRTTQFENDENKPFAKLLDVNGVRNLRTQVFKEHILISKSLLRSGQNVINIQFASPVKTSGAAVTSYVDKEDNAEYVYTLFVPSDASTAFPIFDQPDLKAKFSLTLQIPDEWKAVANTDLLRETQTTPKGSKKTIRELEFSETKPISTYVFAFAAGEFARFREEDFAKKETLRDRTGFERKTRIYVRKSQAAKLINANTGSAGIPARNERESANNAASSKTTRAGRDARAPVEEVFRLNREAIEFLEDWFDYPFPFPKYDLVLIPEFPFGGMEHAGATFLREDRIIFPTEPTKNDFITRANLIFHEAAHQWFGDTVTMKWFDDLWLKEGFAEFMAYKTLEKVLPEYNAWKVFYERNKQAAYLTDVTRGTTPIYQEIPNLSSAKSAYGNIVYRKAPSFLKQAEFYLGEKEFQRAVRAFLKKHEFANAEWMDLVKEFETASKQDLKDWGQDWVTQRGSPKIVYGGMPDEKGKSQGILFVQKDTLDNGDFWTQRFKLFLKYANGTNKIKDQLVEFGDGRLKFSELENKSEPIFIFPNYQDYGYGIFLLDEKSRAYVLENIQNEKDDFLRSMMWGSLWDAVRFYELAPEEYVRLVIENISVEQDESTIATLLSRVSTAMNYYIASVDDTQSVPPALAGGSTAQTNNSKKNQTTTNTKREPSAYADGTDKARLAAALEKLLINKIETAPTVGQKITYFRALQSIGSSEQTKRIFKDLLAGKSKLENVELKTKDKFDLVTRLIILGDKEALDILANLEKQHTDDAAKRYAYAARAGIPSAETKAKYWQDFTGNKEISENWIESAFSVFNTPRHSDLTLPYLERALAELPNLKRNRKIFFVNGWLASFIGGQKSVEALNIVNKFLADNPDLDADLERKILENADNLERAVKIRQKYGK